MTKQNTGGIDFTKDAKPTNTEVPTEVVNNVEPVAEVKVKPQKPIQEQDLSQIIAQSIILAQTAQKEIHDTQIKNEYSRMKSDSDLTGKVGIATKDFADEMKNEIKEGRYVEFMYSTHIAKVKGNTRTFRVSGYTLFFKSGQSTKVPHVLWNDVMLFIEGEDKSQQTIPNIKISVDNGATFTPDDKAFLIQHTNGKFNL